MHHGIMCMYFNFQQYRVSRSVKTVQTNLFAKNRYLHEFATTNSNFEKKSIISDMRHRKTYMYINFQQNRVIRSVKTVRTNIFAKNCELHTFAATNSIFLNQLLKTCIIIKRTCILLSFSKSVLVDQSKPCTQIYLQKIRNCINLQLAIRILKNHAFRTCTTPSRTFRPILRSIGQLDMK